MSKNDSPAGSAGGPVALPDLSDLPEKMRVHALAKLIGVTSREVLAALSGLGHEARSVQSTIERKIVEQVIGALVPGSDDGDADAGATSEEPAPALERAAVLAPVFVPATPLFQAPVRAADDAPSGTPRRGPTVAATAAREGRGARPGAAGGHGRRRDGRRGHRRRGRRRRGRCRRRGRPASSRRRRRGRRGRGRGRGGDESDRHRTTTRRVRGRRCRRRLRRGRRGRARRPGTATRRRRRRRRRKSGTGESEAVAPDDPPNTVVHERAPREKSGRSGKAGADPDEIQGISGSTRLEAKRQRRRDGRDAGRRRPPVLTEAEFLARREAVERVMVVRDKVRTEPPHRRRALHPDRRARGRRRRGALRHRAPRPLRWWATSTWASCRTCCRRWRRRSSTSAAAETACCTPAR